MKNFEIKYKTDDPRELFDFAQGICARKKNLKKKDVKTKSLTSIINGMMLQSGLIAIISVLGFVFLHDDKIMLALSCMLAILALLYFFMCMKIKKTFEIELAKYIKNNGDGGRVMLDESGIREVSVKGTEIKMPWTECERIVITEKIITFLFHIPLVIIFPYTEEAEDIIVQAAKEFGQEQKLLLCKLNISERK